MKKRLLPAVSFFLLLTFCAAFAGQVPSVVAGPDPKLENLISKLRENQDKIQDMSATIVTTIKSDMKEKRTMEQKGTIQTKGKDKTRMEMITPMKQISITNGDKMAMINPETGQKFVQDLKKLKKQTGKQDLSGSPIDQTKILDYFNLSMKEEGIFQKSYVITGTPKEKNQFMGKIVFFVDAGRNVPTKIEIYNPQGKLISSTDMEYVKIKGLWVVSKTSSSMTIPGGKMDVSMRFEDVKINEGIPDSVFDVK